MVRTQSGGIISIDPSFRGLGLMVCMLKEDGKYKILVDDTDILRLSNIKNKKTLTATTLIKCISRWVTYITNKIPEIFECNILLVEKQFHDGMKDLSKAICNQLVQVINSSRILNTQCVFISALTVKRKLGVEYCGSHSKNKQLALNYIYQNESELIGSEYVKSHNQADACLLLNTFLRVKPVIYFMMSGNVYMCPGCKGTAYQYQINKEGSKLKGTMFRGCKSTQNTDNEWVACEKKYAFVTEKATNLYKAFEPASNSEHVGQKRELPEEESTESPVKKRKTDMLSDSEIIKTLEEIKDLSTKIFEILGCYSSLNNNLNVSHYDGVSVE